MVGNLIQRSGAEGFDACRDKADRAIAIQNLVETRLNSLQRRTGARDDASDPIGDHVAVAVGVPDRVLIRTGSLQRNLVATGGLFRADKGPTGVLTHRDERTAILQLRTSPAANRIQEVMVRNLIQRGCAE